MSARYILSILYDCQPYGEYLAAREFFDSREEYEELKTWKLSQWDLFKVFDTKTEIAYREYGKLPEIEFEKEIEV